MHKFSKLISRKTGFGRWHVSPVITTKLSREVIYILKGKARAVFVLLRVYLAAKFEQLEQEFCLVRRSVWNILWSDGRLR